MSKKFYFCFFGVFAVLLISMGLVSGFCTVQGYIYNSTQSRTIADDVNVTCARSGGNETTDVIPGVDEPDDGYGTNFGGLTQDCGYCDEGIFVEASNSSLSISGENSSTSCTLMSCTLDIYMSGAAAPTITATTPLADYNYTPSTKDYNATCTAGSGSVQEVIFISNHTGSETNYTKSQGNVSQAGSVYTYVMDSLPAGVGFRYYWFCNQTDSQSDTSSTYDITINKATGAVSLYLNNSQNNITIENGTYVDINATLDTGTGSIQVYKDGTLINSGASPLHNNTLIDDGIALVNITTIYSGNTNYTGDYETWWINVTADVNPPYFTDIPINLTIDYGDSVSIDFDAEDAEGNFDSYGVNDSRFNINSNGLLTNAQSLGVDVYLLNITINDTSGNTNFTIYKVTVTQSDSACSVLFNETSPITYPANFRAYTNCDTSFTLYRNGTSISNNSVQALGADTYNFTVVRDDQQNYTNVFDDEFFVVSQAAGEVALYLNGTQGNLTIINNTYANLTAVIVSGVNDLELYNNGTLINSGAGPLTNITLFDSLGLYNITAITLGNTNYTSDSETWWLNVSAEADTTPPYFTDIENISMYNNESLYYDVNATDAASSVDCFDVNDTGNFSIDCDGILQNITELEVRTYWLNISVNDTVGNTNSTIIYVNVSEVPPEGEANVTLFGIYEPLCCNNGTHNLTGDDCTEQNEYNESTQQGDVYCEGPTAGEEIVVNVQHIMHFRFENVSVDSNDVLECILEQSDGSFLIVNETGLTLSNANYTLNYSVSNDSVITRDEDNSIHDLPWGLHNCSVKQDGTTVKSNTTYNQVVFMHRNLQWNTFDYQKAVFAESVPFKFFNNTHALKKYMIGAANKSYMRELAFNHYAGTDTEEFCTDGVNNNDGDSAVDSNDTDCRTFTHRYNVSNMNFTIPNFLNFLNLLRESTITGRATSSDDDNIFTESIGGVNYWHTVNTNLNNGSFKIRIYETSPGDEGYGYTIKRFPNVSSISFIGSVPSGYVSSYSCGETAGLDEGYCNINLDCSACNDGLVDFVYIINSSSEDFDSTESLGIEVVHGTAIEEESFNAYFDSLQGLNNTFENETSSGVTDSNLCDDSINNDLDISSGYSAYFSSLGTNLEKLRNISWSRDCADVDCDGANGPSYTAEQDYTFSQGQCEYLTETSCSDGYDNDFNDNYTTDMYGMQGYYYTDCHDADCFRNGLNCPTSEAGNCDDGVNNDWDYVDTNSEDPDGHKIGNTNFNGGTGWNSLKYHHSNRQANLIDCEDIDCHNHQGDSSSGALCEWGHELNCSDGFNNDALQTYDCEFSGTYGTSNDQTPSYAHAEYDCAIHCNSLGDGVENGSECNDGIDNDWDYYLNSSLMNGSEVDGIDCGWNGTGRPYNPDDDCDGETMGNGKTCELGVELTCNDSFDNDYDNKASDSSTRGAEWTSALYEAYFGSGTYSKNADCDDYDCQGKADCPTSEQPSASQAAWCFDGADNDLDGLVDCSDPDCVAAVNPDDATEVCLEYELNDTLLLDTNETTFSTHFCGNNRDDENKEDDNNLSSVFDYNSIGFNYTGNRTEKMDCNDGDCRQKFRQCAPCSDNELVEWDSCFDGIDNDHDGSIDMTDSDCDGQINDTRGYNTTNGPATETSCMNNYDDDNDGLTDCEDSDCDGQIFSPDGRVCLEGSENGATNCSDGYDNDGDGYIDCRDDDCSDECGIDPIIGDGLTYSPKNTSFTVTGDQFTINGTATTVVRKGGDLYVSYEYTSSESNSVKIVLGSKATGEVLDTSVFDVVNADFVSNPDNFDIDRGGAGDGYLTFNSTTVVDSFSFTVSIPGKSVIDNSSTVKSSAEIGTNIGSGTFDVEVVNNQAPSIDVLKIEPSTGNLSVNDKIQVIGGNFTGYSGGQSNSGSEGTCRIQVAGPNGFDVDEYSENCTSSNSNSYKVTSSGTYTVNVTPYDNTGNAGTALSDTLDLQVAPKITSGLMRAEGKRVFMASDNSSFDSFGDEYNSKTGTMIATFETDANNSYTSNACTATIWNESGSIVSSESITASLLSGGQEVTCIVDSSLAGVTDDGLYRVTVNATDSQGFSLQTAELVFFNCNNLTSAGSTWNCSLADFDVDGYTEGISLPFNYYDESDSLINFSCDTCPGVSNAGRDGDGDGYDNACDPICGDGYVEGNEECDDGNLVNGDGCSSTCQIEGGDGDGGDGGNGGDGGDGGGGGGGGDYWFSIEPDPLEVEIRQGQTKTVEFTILNTVNFTLNMEVDYSDLERFVYINEQDLAFELEPGESEDIDLEVFAREEDSPDVYSGQIIFKGNYQTYRWDVFIEVKSGEALFDVETTVLDKTVAAGNDVEAEIKLTDIGDVGRVEAELYYDIRDFENKTWASATETVVIDREAILERALTVPENASTGDYLFYSRLDYNGLIATSADSFTVGGIGGTIVLFAIAMTLVITTTIVIIILYRRNVFMLGGGV